MYNDSNEQYRLVSLVEEAKEELEALNIPFGKIVALEVSHTLTSYGDCRRLYDNCFRIRVNRELLKNASDVIVKETIIHEILHTCAGCMNHGKTWQAYANLVNDAYPRYKISRLSSYNRTHVKLKTRDTAKYIATCMSCNKEYLFFRKTYVVDCLIHDPTSCKCSICNNRNFKIETKR